MSVPGNPPPGGHQNKAPMLRAVIGSELTLATIIVLLRFYTRLRITRSPGTEDWIMLATFLCAVAGTIMEFVGMKYGIGRHIYDLPARDGILATKLDWLSQAPIITALTAGKISVAFLILRISVTKWHSYFLHTVNITLVFINIPLIIWTYHQCKPAALLWDPSIKGTCQDATFGAITDLLYALFPILIVWPLQIPRKRKFHLAGIMCLGSFTEMYVIIIAGSLPTLRPLFQKALASYQSFAQRSSKGYLSHDGEHELQAQPGTKKQNKKKQKRNTARSSEQGVRAEGITKTVVVDCTVSEPEPTEPAMAGGRRKKQRREMWEDLEAGCTG
ncbi:MAG: hypothetical protein LQ345_004365 [Seirophora villosa]|nr:MAG: hypothetical protein LQ345_004365 [Seirophora villosa]